MKNNIEHLRKLRGMTREELAEKVGVTSATIYNKERGVRQLSTTEMTRYAKALGCNPSDLIEENKDFSLRRTGIYPGTFDPITFGHMDVIKRALTIVDRLIIAVADDIPKTPIFSLKEREAMVKGDIKVLPDMKRIEVTSFKGLLVDFAEKNDACLIIRGLRAVSDFEYEFQLSATNTRLKPSVQTVFLPAGEKSQFIASRLVKEVARLGGDVSPFVSGQVAKKLKGYYTKR